MSTLISQPADFVTGLRALRYIFDIPSVGVAPEQIFFIYRIKVDGSPVTAWKRYVPVTSGQDITIDCENDLKGILATNAPPFSLPPGLISTTSIIKQVTVEYGERTINTEECTQEDVVDGETDPVDVLNGINRVFESQPLNAYQILSKRPQSYSIRPDSSDFLYVTGVFEIAVNYYNSGNFISAIFYPINQPHPGAVVNIVPIGFQGAPADANEIRVFADVIFDPVYIIKSEICECQEGAPVDLYVQNHWGGVDLIPFDCVDTMGMSSVKQQIVNRFDPDNANPAIGQRRSVNNTSAPVINLKKQYNDVDFITAQWLNEMAASSNAWIRHRHEAGTDLLIRMEILNGNVQTFGKECELNLSVMYSEVEVYAY